MIQPANWSETPPPDTNWERNSGIDTDVPLYDDSTISYDDPLVFYDGYDATTITVDDVPFTNWNPLNEVIILGGGTPIGLMLVLTQGGSGSSQEIPNTNWTEI